MTLALSLLPSNTAYFIYFHVDPTRPYRARIRNVVTFLQPHGTTTSSYCTKWTVGETEQGRLLGLVQPTTIKVKMQEDY